jgi:pimeloyl-ACP methyl ester carboxylesterase
MHRQVWVALGLASHAFAASALAADAPRSVIDDPIYTHAQRLIDLGSRRMNLYCSGSGAPAVILDSGLSDPDIVWGFVQPILARQTRVCSYDRAGIGYSDPATRASTTGNIVDDLHRLLRAAGVPAPYIMVGHSLGGLDVQLYAYRHPHEVAGMVLVDSAYEGEFEGPGGERLLDTKTAQLLDQFRKCVAAAPDGFVAGTELFKECIDGPDSEPNVHFSAAISAALAAVQARPAFQRAQLSELESAYAVGAHELLAARRPYGDMPLEVLTAGAQPKGDPTAEDSARSKEAWAAHEAVAKLSTRGIHRTIADSPHYIQLYRPEEVIAAIKEIMGRIRDHR